MLKVGIIGATGYGGLELVRLLARHPEVELTALSSVSFEGKRLSEIYPAMAGIVDLELGDDQLVLESSQVIFAALPHGLSQEYGAVCIRQGKVLIDLGADFRLEKEEDYTQWYGGTFDDPSLHQQAVYGLPELFREEILGAKIVANPGCYPTSAALGLAPLAKKGLLKADSIVIDAKSGSTGAGRGLSQTTHFAELSGNFAPYAIAQHRHTPEIEQTLSHLAGSPVTITFVPHLLPINRGILSTIYCESVESLSKEELHQLYADFYKEEPFVRVLPLGSVASIRGVAFSNYCDLSVHTDPRTGRIIVVSALDNMIKGAAGQAVQNLNLLYGYPETTGLDLIPPSF